MCSFVLYVGTNWSVCVSVTAEGVSDSDFEVWKLYAVDVAGEDVVSCVEAELSSVVYVVSGGPSDLLTSLVEFDVFCETGFRCSAVLSGVGGTGCARSVEWVDG